MIQQENGPSRLDKLPAGRSATPPDHLLEVAHLPLTQPPSTPTLKLSRSGCVRAAGGALQSCPSAPARPAANSSSSTTATTDWKVLRYLHDWCQISKAIDIATGYFEIGALLGLEGRVAEGRQDPHPDGRRSVAADQGGLRRGPGKVAEQRSTTASRSREAEERLPARRPRHRRSASARARSSAASTARRSSTPRRTSPTPAWKSSAPPRWSAPRTSPTRA